MAKQADKQKVRSSHPSDKFTLPKSKADVRPLTETELQRLESALGKSVDRQYLAHWVSEAIRDVTRLSILPSAPELRTDLMRMAREGRQWLRHATEYSDTFLPRQRSALDLLLPAAEAFCTSRCVDQSWPPSYPSRTAGIPRQDDRHCETGKGPAQYADAGNTNQAAPSPFLPIRFRGVGDIKGRHSLFAAT
jgi:hypothetical protein